jgi:peptidoglycan hydrolase-like protein with peptidoglycan-binding domain
MVPLLAAALATGTVTALSAAAPAAAASCTEYSFTNPNIGFATVIPKSQMSEGSTGPCVALLQDYLNLAINSNLAVDSQFGPKTLAAVKSYQGENLACTGGADGIAGPYTMSCLVAGSG